MSAAEIVPGCERALVEIGFRRVDRGLVVRELRAGFTGSIGLNVATRTAPGAVGVNPVVGVRWKSVEHLLEELGYAGTGATIYTPLETLVDGRPELMWWFESVEDVRPVAATIADAVASCGVPFMEAHADPEACLRFIERELPREQRAYRLPVAFLVVARPQDAEEALERGLKLAGARSNPWAVAYREFAAEVRKRL